MHSSRNVTSNVAGRRPTLVAASRLGAVLASSAVLLACSSANEPGFHASARAGASPVTTGACMPDGDVAVAGQTCCSGNVDPAGYCVPDPGDVLCDGNHFPEQCASGFGQEPYGAGVRGCTTCSDGTTRCICSDALWGCALRGDGSWGTCAAPDPRVLCDEQICAVPPGSTIATSNTTIASMVGDDNGLYWTAANEIWGLALAGGAVPAVVAAPPGQETTDAYLASSSGALGFSFTDWSTPGSTMFGEIARGAAAGTTPASLFTGSRGTVASITTDGTYLYAAVSENNGSIQTDNPAFQGSVVAAGIARSAIVTDGTNLYYSTYSYSTGQGTILETPLGPTAAPTTFATTDGFVQQMVLSGGTLFWIECRYLSQNAPNNSPMECNVRGLGTAAAQSPTTYQTAYDVGTLAVDSANVYWSVADGNRSASRIQRAPVAGGPVSTIVGTACPANNDGVVSIVVNDLNLYWACKWSIQSMGKP